MPLAARASRHVVAGVDVAGHDDGHAESRSREPGRVVSQHLVVAAVGAADE